MAKDPHKELFFEAKQDVVDNLEAIKIALERCIEDGLIDTDSFYYNELIDLIDEAEISKDWNELYEVIVKGKALEVDVSEWLARQGRSNMSLPWPSPPRQ
jgi:hypothetical protein